MKPDTRNVWVCQGKQNRWYVKSGFSMMTGEPYIELKACTAADRRLCKQSKTKNCRPMRLKLEDR